MASNWVFRRHETYAEGVAGVGIVNVRKTNGDLLLALSAAAAEDLASDLLAQAKHSRQEKGWLQKAREEEEALRLAKARHPANNITRKAKDN